MIMTTEKQLSILDIEDIYWKLKDYEILIDALYRCVDVHFSNLGVEGRCALHEVTVLLGVFEEHHRQQLSQLQKLIEDSSHSRFFNEHNGL